MLVLPWRLLSITFGLRLWNGPRLSSPGFRAACFITLVLVAFLGLIFLSCPAGLTESRTVKSVVGRFVLKMGSKFPLFLSLPTPLGERANIYARGDAAQNGHCFLSLL